MCVFHLTYFQLIINFAGKYASNFNPFKLNIKTGKLLPLPFCEKRSMIFDISQQHQGPTYIAKTLQLASMGANTNFSFLHAAMKSNTKHWCQYQFFLQYFLFIYPRCELQIHAAADIVYYVTRVI